MSGRTHVTRFRVRKDSVAAARHHVRDTLIGWRLGLLIEDAVLITSELAGNVVNHAKGMGDHFELAMRRRSGVLILEVADSYQWQMPELQKPGPDDLSGRGLLIVDALSENWGVRPRNPGKTVWAHLPINRIQKEETAMTPKATSTATANTPATSPTAWGLGRMRPFPRTARLPYAAITLDPHTQTGEWLAADGSKVPALDRHKASETSAETTTSTSLDGNRDQGSDQSGDSD
ncbi:putative ATP-grasp-modified RiPP [Streptomyces celluloflavus]|uniref:putative ATP-grasp-modified RiPP n=1 Tax=Streptomyces celluloflavus TaxID=58344 RepID=UPI0037BACA80